MSLRRSAPMVFVAIVLTFGGCKSRSENAGDQASRDAGRTTTSTTAGGTATTESVTVTTGGATTGAPTTTTTMSGAGTGSTGGDTGGVNGSDGSDPNLIEVTISGGAVDGGVQTRTVKTGAQVTLRVTSDASDVVHIHGYDLRVDVVGGSSADLTFLAKTSGTFVVELEKQHRKVLDLQVQA